jgi:hypothetical protein
VKVLRQDKLIEEERDDEFVALAAGAATDQIVRSLVQNEISVYEISRHEPNLEEFYLSLMKAGKPPTPAGKTARFPSAVTGHRSYVFSPTAQ